MEQKNRIERNTPVEKQQKPDGLLKKLWNTFSKSMTYQEGKSSDEDFILLGVDEAQDEKKKEERTEPEKSILKRPVRIKRFEPRVDDRQGKMGDIYSLEHLLVDPKLSVNKELIEKIYSLPINKDIVVRDFIISLDPPVNAFAVFIEGISDGKIINQTVLKPLMILSKLEDRVNNAELADYLKKRILHGNQVDVLEKITEILEKINYGGTAVFIDGSPLCLTIETKGWDRRAVGKPQNEQVIRGPHEAFNETLRSNTGLIRKAVRNENLITEMFKIGERNRTDLAIMYLKDLANPNLVEEVKRRVTSIKSDYIGETGILEQFIEEHPFMASPSVLFTERPDRVVSLLMEGKVAILMDGNPNVLVVPTTIFALLHNPEDYYQRLPYGNLMRFIRVSAAFFALPTPAIYLSITNFHQEMIPTDLILTISAAREAVPFPTIVEIIIMEFFFELIREAGVRVPGVIGNTLGIVGALILGQAAVEAGIVSPILIIVIAVTGLASFAIPNYSMSFAFRGMRFLFTGVAAVFGFFGVTAGLFMFITSLAGMKSFGVPLLSPVGPRSVAEPDIVLRGPVFSLDKRSDYADTLDRKRQPKISRGWVKKNQNKEKGGEKGSG